MYIIQLKIETKSKLALNKFLMFFHEIITKPIFKFGHSYVLNIKNSNREQHNNKITILTSPHINKNAQEHYVIKQYSKKINIFFFKNLKFITFIKKVNKIVFPEINIKIKFIKTKETSIIISQSINPEMYKT